MMLAVVYLMPDVPRTLLVASLFFPVYYVGSVVVASERAGVKAAAREAGLYAMKPAPAP